MQAQLSTATISLAIATCIPFGLAIKDTVTARYADAEAAALEAYGREHAPSNDPDSDDEDYREVARRRAIEDLDRRAAIAKQERQEQAEREQREIKVRSLYGAEVATLGSAFDEIRLGQKVTERPDARALGFDTMLLDNGAASHTLWIQLRSGDCRTLASHLHDVWGDGRRHDSREVWVNEHVGQRAVLAVQNVSRCELTFEKVVPLASWLGKSQSSIVPMWAVGQPFAKLKAALGDKIPGDGPVGNQIMWLDVGLGASFGTTEITAYVEGGRVIGVLATFHTDVQTQDRLIERISELTGKQPQDDAPIWKSTPSIEIQAGSQFSLIIGKQPK